MKFSATLEFNAVREWSDHYIAYDKLKALIYEIEAIAASKWRNVTVPDEELPLLLEDPEIQEKEKQFELLILKELDRISAFYREKEDEFKHELVVLEEDVPKYFERDSDISLLLDTSPATPSDSHRLRTISNAYVKKEELIRRIRDLYINLCSLKDFVVLNYTGFSKILKKHDKVLGIPIKPKLMPVVECAYFWKQNSNSYQSNASINDLIDRTAILYAKATTDGNIDRAMTELGHYLREFVIWERNTIWRDMVGKERRITAAGVKRVQKPHVEFRYRVRLPGIGYFTIRPPMLNFIIISTIFLILVFLPTFDKPEKSKCFAILIYASLLWAFEVLPLYVTSMLIPFLIVLTSILRDDKGQFLSAPIAAKKIIGEMFSPVILLLLGGFTIAAALSKHQIAKRMATFMLSRAGTRSRSILLTIMFVATFASMWLSNVAAPVLCFSVIEPILRTLEPGNKFAKSLIMGIALASNVGGLVTPISSPQNAIALQYMNPPVAWLPWLSVTIPISIIADLICWLMILVVYNPSKATPRVAPIRQTDEPLNRTQIYVISVSLFTILLWCLESTIRNVVGHSGIIAIVPMLLFFGTGILNKDDFNNFLWTVIMLAMGGTALGYAVKDTKLLDVIAGAIKDSMEGQSVWVVLLAFSSLLLVAATFVSHTVSALIVLPLVQKVGQELPGDHANLLVMGSAIMCSGAMGLPISGFPNITAVSIEDSTGQPFVKTKDFLKIGVPMSVIMVILTVTIGYGLMLLVGI